MCMTYPLCLHWFSSHPPHFGSLSFTIEVLLCLVSGMMAAKPAPGIQSFIDKWTHNCVKQTSVFFTRRKMKLEETIFPLQVLIYISLAIFASMWTISSLILLNWGVGGQAHRSDRKTSFSLPLFNVSCVSNIGICSHSVISFLVSCCFKATGLWFWSLCIWSFYSTKDC